LFQTEEALLIVLGVTFTFRQWLWIRLWILKFENLLIRHFWRNSNT